MQARTARDAALLAATIALLRFLLVRWVRRSDLPMGSADHWAPVPRAPRPLAGVSGAAVAAAPAPKAATGEKTPAKKAPPAKKAAPAKKAPPAKKTAPATESADAGARDEEPGALSAPTPREEP